MTVMDEEAALAAAAAALTCDKVPACDKVHVTFCIQSSVPSSTAL